MTMYYRSTVTVGFARFGGLWITFQEGVKALETETKSRRVRDVVHYVKDWRKDRRLSVDELGRLAGVSGSMISQLERGRTSYTQNTLELLAGALECEPWQLIASPPTHYVDIYLIALDRMVWPSIHEGAQPVVRALVKATVDSVIRCMEEKQSLIAPPADPKRRKVSKAD